MTTPFRISYLIEDARLVAILNDGGGAVVENDRRFLVVEGRSYYDHESSRITPGAGVLEYFCCYTIDGAPEPDTTVGVDAELVITGTLATGGWIEVRGSGDLRYDENGNPEGEFSAMPRIIVQQQEPVEHEPDPRCLSAEEWVEHMKSISPKTSEDFERATAGRDRDAIPDDTFPAPERRP